MNKPLKKSTVICFILICAFCFIIMKRFVNLSDDVFLRMLNNNDDALQIREMYPIAEKPEGTSANQGFAIHKDIIFQLYSDNKLILINLVQERDNVITELNIHSLHGDTIDFSNDYIKDEEFPLAYITADTNPANIFCVQISRKGTSLIKTYSFKDIQKTGYYAGHCIDTDNRIIYLVGYNKNNYYDPDDNFMIVSSWDMDHFHKNDDGTITPEFLEAFNIPFIVCVQGQRYFKGMLYLLSSHTGVQDIAINTSIFIINPQKGEIENVYDKFPEKIRTTECEGIEFIKMNGELKMVISTYGDPGKYFCLSR